jgi:hypothetical protein
MLQIVGRGAGGGVNWLIVIPMYEALRAADNNATLQCNLATQFKYLWLMYLSQVHSRNLYENHATLHATEQSCNLATQQSCNL